MKRILAVTAALVLMAALLGPIVLADRGGRGVGVGQGNAPPSQGPSGGPAPDRTGDQERKQDAKEARERARAESSGNGAAVLGGDAEGDDGAPKPGNGNRPEVPPGQAVSAAVRSRFASEGETTENIHRVRVQLQIQQTENPAGDDDGDDGGDTEPPKGLAQRIWAWQRALINSAKRMPKLNNGVKPFMMVGQAEVGDDGTLSVTVWKGNRLVRDYLYADDTSAITVTLAGEVRLVDASGVTVCDLATDPGCLTRWLEDNPDAYVSVWGRVEVIDGEEVFVAHRITVTVPNMEGDDSDDAPTPIETIPAPTATPAG